MEVIPEESFIPDYEEEVVAAKQTKRLPCLICKGTFAKVAYHVIRQHLPLFLVSDTRCWDCGLQLGKPSSLTVHLRHSECGDTGRFAVQHQGGVGGEGVRVSFAASICHGADVSRRLVSLRGRSQAVS
jgi:hypothetical protein